LKLPGIYAKFDDRTSKEERVNLNSLSSNIESQRIVDSVYGTLRRAISRHELEPGFHLSVPALAQHFGVSRSPVREAVQRLVSEGLAAEQPRRGAYVSHFDSGMLLPLYQVRMVLDGLAARLAAEHATQEGTSGLDKLLAAGRHAIDKDDLERHIELDIEFHRSIFKLAGNDTLSETLQKIYDRLQAAMVSRVVPTGPERAYEDHLNIFKAIQARDGDAAEAAARAHVSRLILEF